MFVREAALALVLAAAAPQAGRDALVTTFEAAAPGDPGARRKNIGNIRPTSNAERRDASPVECRGTFTTGC